MLSIRKNIKETFAFIKGNPLELLKNIWFVLALDFGMRQVFQWYGEGENILYHLGLLLLVYPLYTRPIVSMGVHGQMTPPNILGLRPSLADGKYIGWSLVVLLGAIPTLFCSFVLLQAVPALESLSSQSPSYGVLGLLSLVVIITTIVTYVVWMYMSGRLSLIFASFYDKKRVSLSDSWALLKGKVIKFWIITGWAYVLMRFMGHYAPHQALRHLMEITGEVVGIVAYVFLYKTLMKKR